MAGPGVVAMRPGPSDINCLQGIYAAGGAGMGIKPLAGGEGGGYVVNVQVLGPTTALGWVGAAFVLLGAWVFYKTEPAPGSTKTEISSVPYKNTRIFYRERTILPVFVYACICLCCACTCLCIGSACLSGVGLVAVGEECRHDQDQANRAQGTSPYRRPGEVHSHGQCPQNCGCGQHDQGSHQGGHARTL